MIEEAAGTRMFETKKLAAYKTMSKKDKKVRLSRVQFRYSLFRDTHASITRDFQVECYGFCDSH